MNNKSRNKHSACAASTTSNVSDNKFLKDYYKVVKNYLDDGLSDYIPSFPDVEKLKHKAETAFIQFYGFTPTCAVYAPGCVTIAGKSTDLVESTSLSMAIQLITLIIGKRTHGTNWCQILTLAGDRAADKTFELKLNDENLRIGEEETSWLRYFKGAIRSFKARRGGHVPAFQLIVASSLPVKRGFGSNSALVVAFYTFLEALTNTYTGNSIEKTMACHAAMKLAASSSNVRITDILTSVLGVEDKILVVDSHTLNIAQCDWNGIDVELILIDLPNNKDSTLPTWRTHEIRYKEIMTVLNTKLQWRIHPIGASMMEFLFPEEILEMAKTVINENERIYKMADAIRAERWEDFGKLLSENHTSAVKYLSVLAENVDAIVNMLEKVEGVLGACATGFGASIVVLVQRSKLKDFITFMNRKKISEQYFILQSCKGASTIYTYERRIYPWLIKHPSRPALVIQDRRSIRPLQAI